MLQLSLCNCDTSDPSGRSGEPASSRGTPPAATQSAPMASVAPVVSSSSVAQLPSYRSASHLLAAPPGTWRRCHQGYRALGSAEDVVRTLGLLCGPSTGMRALRGDARPTSFEARSGQCFRVFVAATVQRGEHRPPVRVLVSQRATGARVLEVTLARGWGVVPKNEPLCLALPGHYDLDVSGSEQQISHAVWTLP